MDPCLVDARDEEDLVVHREAEHDREDHHGQERLDRAAGDPEQAAEPAPLEDRDDDTERGADREQVHQRRLERDQQRPEHDEQEQRREQDDAGDEDPQLRRDDVREVDLRRCEPADVDRRPGRALERRDHVCRAGARRATRSARSAARRPDTPRSWRRRRSGSAAPA